MQDQDHTDPTRPGATIIPLIDGALYYDPRTARQAMVARMAADLVAWDAFGNEADAFRSLIFAQDDAGARKYGTIDVSLLLRDAIAEARQIVIASEMSAS